MTSETKRKEANQHAIYKAAEALSILGAHTTNDPHQAL
ncbi:hypothetical protein PAAL109150_12270 [Paenibacillus alkaliterrae]